MAVQRWSLSLVSADRRHQHRAGGRATIWLLLTNPVTVANAVNEGDVSPFVHDLAQVLYARCRGC